MIRRPTSCRWSTPSNPISAKSSASTNTSMTRTGLLSSMKSSRHSGNSVHCQRSASSTKRLIYSPGEALLAFYDFPAEHWKHLRTTNVIESAFATVRHRTVRAKGCLSNKTALAMIFKLAEAAEKCWRRLDGHNQLPKIILGVRFADGMEVVRSQHQAAAA